LPTLSEIMAACHSGVSGFALYPVGYWSSTVSDYDDFMTIMMKDNNCLNSTALKTSSQNVRCVKPI
jgi:hypothetical protein